MTSRRTQFYHSAYFPVVFLLFIAGFYFIPESKWMTNQFRIGLLLPFLLVFPWRQLPGRLAASPTLQVTGLLVGYLLLSLLWSPEVAPGKSLKVIFQGIYLCVFILIGTDLLLRRPDYSRQFFYWLGWVTTITGVISIALFFSGHAFPLERMSAIGQLHHPGFAAAAYGVVGLYHFLSIPVAAATSLWQRWLPGALSASTALLIVILCQSRGALAGLLVTVCVGYTVSRQRRFLAVLLAAALVVLVAMIGWGDELWQMASRDGLRQEIWLRSLGLIQQAPVLGYGVLAAFPAVIGGIEISHAHNLVLSASISGGLVAGGLLLCLMLLVLRQALRSRADDEDIRPLLVCVYCFIYVMSDGGALITGPQPVWVFFWLPVIWAASHEATGPGDRRLAGLADVSRER
jgi:O-antigen ligase